MSRSARTALALSFLACTVLMVFGLGRWGQALVHGNSNGCYLRLYSELPKDVRVLIAGSSRLRRSDLGDTIARNLGYPLEHIGDLAHPFMAMHFDYGMVDRLSQKQPIDLLIYEVRPTGPALRQALERGSDAFERYGTPETAYKAGLPIPLIAKHIFSKDTPLSLRTWEFVHTMNERMAFAASLIASPKRVLELRDAQTGIRKPWNGTHCFLAEWEDQTKRMQQGSYRQRSDKDWLKQYFSTWQDPEPLGFFDSPDMAEERDIIRRVVSLGTERGFTPIFLYLPKIHIPLDREGLARRFIDTFDAPLLIPEDHIRAQLNTDTYQDMSHPNSKGRQILQNWFGNALSEVASQKEISK